MENLTIEETHVMQETLTITPQLLFDSGAFWIGLLTEDGNEVSGLGYARKHVTNADADIAFPAVFFGVSYGLWDAQTGGNFIGSAPIEKAEGEESENTDAYYELEREGTDDYHEEYNDLLT